MTTGRMSNKNLRLCVVMRFLGRQSKGTDGAPVIAPDVLEGAANAILELDSALGEALQSAFKGRKVPMPIDAAMEIVDLWIQRTGRWESDEG